MAITRFMQVMFSNDDEELANQVDRDIKAAQENGAVDTEEVKYERTPEGDVAITDKENGEVTIAQKATDETDTYDLIAVPDEQLEKFLHPSNDGVHEGNQVGAPDEHIMDHFHPGDVISPNLPDGGLNPEAGFEKTVDENYNGYREFSVSSDNTVVQRIFSDQEFCERIFSEVIESEETAKVGDLKIEKIDDDAVVVTNETTGDQAKVVLDDDDMTVTELDSKNFSEEVGYLPMYVVGVQPFDHIIVDSPVYGQEAAEALAARFTEDGIDAVQVFEDPQEARDYAMKLIDSLNAELPDDEEPVEEKEYSDVLGVPVYSTRFYSDNSDVMCRMFSETVNGITDLQDEVEDAIREGDEIEMDDVVITPVDAQNAVIEDKETGEFTKATMTGEDMRLEQIDADEYNDLTSDLSVIQSESEIDQPLSDDDEDVCPECGKEECECEDDDDDEEREYSYLDEDELYENEYSYCDDTETRFFSEGEEFTEYMERIYSGVSDQDAIEDAIENGDQIETEDEVITPVDSKTAVVQDKENGEFTKVTIVDEDAINLHPISDEEAENLTEDLGVDETSAVDEDEEEDDEEREYSYSDEDELYENDYSYCDETETRFFSEGEEFTNYMERIYSEEADQDEIEKAIEEGEQIENDDEVITPVDSKTAVIEDKETGEFTKATLDNDDEMNLTKISEDEADELTEDLAVEDNDEDEDEKEYSYCDETETRFFSEGEEFTDYMERIYSDEADQDEIEKAIEEGEQIENDSEVITPVDSKTAVIEDKETGEFTKATLDNDDEMNLTKISEDEADDLTEDLAVEDNDVDEDEEEKKFSTLNKFFSDMQQQAAAPAMSPQQAMAPAAPAAQPAVTPMDAAPAVDENGQPVPPVETHTVEEVEDKALAAVQSIKAAAEEATAAIMDAKAAPAEGVEPDIQEAQFSERTFSDGEEDTLTTWLNFKS